MISAKGNFARVANLSYVRVSRREKIVQRCSYKFFVLVHGLQREELLIYVGCREHDSECMRVA